MSDYAVSQLIARIDNLEHQISKLRRAESRGWEINYVVPAGGVASYTISNIPQYARHIRVIAQARGDAASNFRNLYARINADAGANYNYQYTYSNAAVVTAAEVTGATEWRIGTIAAATATAKYSGAIDMVIPWYGVQNTDVFKLLFMSSNYVHNSAAAAGRYLMLWQGDYMGNAPMTSITFLPSSGNFVEGSVFTMYGTG
jgi:hypothetical protein